MEIAVVGPLEFTLGFQLAGVKNLHNPSNDEELSEFERARQASKTWSMGQD